MGPAQDQELQERSRVLFGQAHRLAVMHAIARSSDGVINPGDLAFELGFRAQSSIQNPIRDLLDAKLIRRIPSVTGERRVYYTRAPSKVWDWIEDVVADVEIERDHQRLNEENR